MADYRYVQRNGQGAIIASFAVAQPGIAEEAIDANDPALAPPPPPPPPPPQPLDARLWLERLSPAKQLAIAAAGRASDALFLWLLKAAGAQSGIVLNDPETPAGVAALVAAGVITTEDQALLLAP